MVKLINNIKKTFIYIIGTLFFIVSLYVMLIPHNCKLKNKGFFESFTDEMSPNTDSINTYMIMIGKNKKPIADFDNHLNIYKNIIQDGQPNGKLLILSRCYQMPNQIIPDIQNNNNMLGSYTEAFFIKKVRDFDTDVLQKIRDSINNFYTNLNFIPNCNKKTSIIEGTVYVLIAQYPLYKDNSNDTVVDVNISSSMLPQSVTDIDNNRYIYQPSYIAPISNNLLNNNTTNAITNTPISYVIYIIYDSYETGPKSTTNNGISGCIQKIPENTQFSKNLKKEFDKSISSAEQCFISAMGASGFSYIGGCASYQGTSPSPSTSKSQAPSPLTTKENTIPNNKSFCTSPIQGDNKPWSYVTLYTVNHNYIQFSVAQN